MKMKREGEGRMGKTRRSLRTVFVLIFLIQSLLPVCSGQNFEGIPSSVKSPQDVEKWLSGFQPQMQLPDVPQTVKEMLDTRAGDCDDFAVLASKALEGLGISSTVLVIKFKGTNIRHAICLWKNENGACDFFTTKKLIRTREMNVDDVMKRYYPLYESVSVLDIGERGAL